MAHFFPLGAQVFKVGTGCGHLDRHPFDDFEPVTFEPDDFFGVVGHQAELARPQFNEDLSADSIVPEIGFEAQSFVGLNGIVPGILKGIGLEFVNQPDATSLLTHVKDNSTAFLVNLAHRGMELVPAITTLGTENVTCQALGMHPDQ
jgi:hypothetical protein